MSNPYIPDQLHHMSKKELLEFAQTAHEENVKLAQQLRLKDDLIQRCHDDAVIANERVNDFKKFIAAARTMFLDLDEMEVNSIEYAELLGDLFNLFCDGDEFHKYVNKFAIEQKIEALEEVKDKWIKKASEMPLGLECRSKGSSCYNWAMFYAKELTDEAEQLRKEQE